jgi:tetratricopeptide (TPR) repeat protein
MDIDNLAKIATDYFQKGDLQKAESLFREILAFQPNNINILHYLGVISFQFLNYDNTIEYLHKAIEIEANDPINFFAYNILGESFFKKGNTDDAIINYQKALELNPSYALSHFNL